MSFFWPKHIFCIWTKFNRNSKWRKNTLHLMWHTKIATQIKGNNLTQGHQYDSFNHLQKSVTSFQTDFRFFPKWCQELCKLLLLELNNIDIYSVWRQNIIEKKAKPQSQKLISMKNVYRKKEKIDGLMRQ